MQSAFKIQFSGLRGQAAAVEGAGFMLGGSGVQPVKEVFQFQDRDQERSDQGHQTSRQGKEAGSQATARGRQGPCFERSPNNPYSGAGETRCPGPRPFGDLEPQLPTSGRGGGWISYGYRPFRLVD